MTLLPWENVSILVDMFLRGTRKRQTFSLEVFEEDQGSLHQLPLLSPQFREKLQDVLPSLPSQDDYFLLKWLRGNPKVGTALVRWEPP